MRSISRQTQGILLAVVLLTTPSILWSAAKDNRGKKTSAKRRKRGKGKPAPAKASPDLAPNLKALRLGIEDLKKQYGAKYANATKHLSALGSLEKEKANANSPEFKTRYKTLQMQALVVDNPAIDFEKIMLIKRDGRNMGLPQNWQGNSNIRNATKMKNEILTLNLKDPKARPQLLHKPAKDYFVGDLQLHFDARTFLFSSIGGNGRWQVFEIQVDGKGLRQVTPNDPADIDNYDAMYLPDERMIFNCSSTFVGVPCVGGKAYVANIHIMDKDGKNIRRLTYDQDNNFYPTMLPDGKVLYLRWEYTDSAHYFSRVLMRMNPDGTNQMEFYGSNSYWPNSLFYSKPLPGSTTKFIGVVSGHHGVPRMGELHLFDTSLGRTEDAGVVQQIPGHGKKFKGPTIDRLVDKSWPKFLHPQPLSHKHFLVACQPNAQSNWGVYVVDIFDNMVRLIEEPGWAMLEPVPLKKTERPPVIPDRVNLKSKTATIFLHDIHLGPGLRGVPRGTTKALRIFQYEYSYRNMGGHYQVGIEGPWDIRRIIGTVPVNPDGSALFEIPANTPVSIQPLDAEGKAMQQIRSWFVGMPGEYLSCTGCHEQQNSSAPIKRSSAAAGRPNKPKPWYGQTRGFSFLREVQPVLDKYCVGCHDGSKPGRPDFKNAKIIKAGGGMASFPASYVQLHPYVRRNGPEGDYHVLTPLEFHADTSELIQMLTKGHHNVKLDAEGWDRLITWIDLNVPAHGTWHEVKPIPSDFAKRRLEMRKLYSFVDEDIEAIPELPKKNTAFVKPAPAKPRPAAVKVTGWPFAKAKAQQMQKAAGQAELKLDLGNGATIALNCIPAGEFAMGNVKGANDEFPMAKVKIAKPFWIGATEVSLKQFQQFNPKHKNGYYDMHYKDQVKPGYLMDGNPEFPVIRVSWDEAMAFCAWLSKKTGKKVTLPTEAQWEWACRAGTSTPFWYGDLNTDFSAKGNMADKSISQLAVKGVNPKPIRNPDKFWDFVPKDARFDDKVLHLAPVTQYEANPWGLHNMHGNVGEWTRNAYHAYPYDAKTEAANAGEKKVVRGGSWRERPKLCRSAYRLPYPKWQQVYNVGFRVIVEK